MIPTFQLFLGATVRGILSAKRWRILATRVLTYLDMERKELKDTKFREIQIALA